MKCKVRKGRKGRLLTCDRSELGVHSSSWLRGFVASWLQNTRYAGAVTISINSTPSYCSRGAMNTGYKPHSRVNTGLKIQSFPASDVWCRKSTKTAGGPTLNSTHSRLSAGAALIV